MITNRINHINKEVLLKRYILIFTLALISCAGTNYIHSLTSDKDINEIEAIDGLDKEVVNRKDVMGVKQDLCIRKINQMI